MLFYDICCHNFTIFEYLDVCKSANTYKTYKIKSASYRFMIRHFGTAREPETITVRDMQEYIQIRHTQNSLYQARIDAINIKAMFTYYQKQDRLTTDIFSKIAIPKIPDKQPLYLSREEYEILLKKSTAPFRDILPLCVQTGLRLSELLSIEKQDIDFPGGFLIVGRRKITKSKKTRIIPLTENLLSLFKAYPEGRLFPYSESHICHGFKNLVRGSGVNPKLHFHSLRHTFASWLVQAGVSIYSVQKLMGHSSVTVTSVYSHLELSDLRGCIEKIKGV